MRIRAWAAGVRGAGIVLAGVATAVLSACGGSSAPASTASGSASTSVASAAAGVRGQAAAVTVADPWVKAADTGMTAGFAALTNTTASAVTVVAASSPASSQMQLHETVKDATGATSMRERQGGLVIPAGATVTLAPGGDHLMFMGLTSPLKSGTTTSVTLSFSDSSTLPFTAEVRAFSAAKESYEPTATSSTPMEGMPSASHG